MCVRVSAIVSSSLQQRRTHTRDKTQYTVLSFEPSAHYQMRNLAAEKQILMQTHPFCLLSQTARACVCVWLYFSCPGGISVSLAYICEFNQLRASPHIHITCTCVLYIGFLKISTLETTEHNFLLADCVGGWRCMQYASGDSLPASLQLNNCRAKLVFADDISPSHNSRLSIST